MSKKTKDLLPMENLEHAAGCLRTISHPARLRMIQMMLQDRYTVGELAEACEIKSHVASEHLRLMQHCNLLKSDREGQRIYYQVEDPALASIISCVEKRFG